MRTILNFTLAILLLVAFIGSGAFFVSVSSGLKLKRVESQEEAVGDDSE